MEKNTDRPVIVTGGASGIGFAIVQRLLDEGYPVAVFDLNCTGLQTLGDNDLLHPFEVDITEYESVASVVAEFESATGPVYGLVNNAGWDSAKLFVKTDIDFWRKVIDINLYGPLNVTHLALKRMAELDRGRVISIASDAGRVGSSGEAVYSATKGGIIALMKTLAREHARQDITCNSICPGPTDTPLFAAIDKTGRLNERLQRAIPKQRLGRPDDYPGLVAFFLSDDASFITGQTISVSGGLTMSG
ncbi:MAG: SDR family NAD(P)-dependent oxidoreductase [Gammaproteobacteria bacterium]|nr:SDR family NAD(P)-dependent oxidoreductase [Gammaproteobacteria bacterium]